MNGAGFDLQDFNFKCLDLSDSGSATNTAPIAHAGADSVVAIGAEVVLDSGASFDSDGDALSYQWTIKSRPVGSTVELSSTAAPNPSFIADVAGDFVFELVVNDGIVDSEPAQVQVNVESATVALSGRVIDTSDVVIQGVIINALDPDSGEITATKETDAEGNFVLDINPEISHTISSSTAGYADYVTNTEDFDDVALLEITLIDLGSPELFAEDDGGVIGGEDGAKVTLLGNSFVRQFGTGYITSTITPINPTNFSERKAFPGAVGSEEEIPFVLLGAVDFEFTDDQGSDFDLAEGVNARIEIPLYLTQLNGKSIAIEGAYIPFSSLDEISGHWVEEGRGRVVTNTLSPTGYAVVAEVSHFSWYCACAINPSAIVESDLDSDGIPNYLDAFPLDANESKDTDDDGVGDNSDAFPTDASESVDTDGDGIGDNADEFPTDSSESIDTDRDGIGNNADTVLDSKITYYHVNLQGTPVATTNKDGAIEWSESHSAFGYNQGNNSRQIDEFGAHVAFGLGGHVEDTVSGRPLVYMQQRYYDPELGRFLSIDPVGFDEANPQSFNRYAYANNNPNIYVDPDGRAAETAVNPSTGKPIQPPGGMTRAERKKFVRERSHVEQSP